MLSKYLHGSNCAHDGHSQRIIYAPLRVAHGSQQLHRGEPWLGLGLPQPAQQHAPKVSIAHTGASALATDCAFRNAVY